jgi:tetratricopeptide (TPR) repeat protein
MSITITCPDCRATLKANKTPRSDKLMQCLKCGHRFTLTDSLAKSSAIIAAPLLVPRSPATRGRRTAVVGVAVLFLAVVGVAGAYFASRPSPTPEKSLAIAEVKVPTPEPRVEPKAESKEDPELEQRRERFTQLMIDAGIATQLRKHEAAITAYADALLLFPDNADVRDKLTEARANQEKARLDLERVQTETAALLKQGQAALDGNQFTAAADFFKLALEKSPTNDEAAQKLVEAQSRLQQAVADKKALEDFDNHILAGKAALKAGRPADALRDFTAANKILPKDPLPPELIKEAETQLVQVKNPDDRKKQYENLLDQASRFQKLKKLDEAEDSYRQALKLYPNDPVALRGLESTQKSLKLARADVTKLLKQANNSLSAGQLADAIGFLRNAEALMPTHPDVVRALRAIALIQQNQIAYFQAIQQANTAMALRRYGDALIAYSAALAIVPNDPLATVGAIDAQRGLQIQNVRQIEYDALVNQGVALLKAQRYAEAARTLESALRLVRPPAIVDPQIQSLTLYADAMAQGLAALHARQFPLAAQMFQRALVALPGDLAAQSGLQKARLGVKV